MTKPVLLAGLLGGLLGGMGGFALTRALPAKVAPAAAVEKPHEARALADDLLAKLNAGKTEEFLAAMRPGYPEFSDEEFDARVRQQLLTARSGFALGWGGPGEFEFVGTTIPTTTLARFTYLERFPRGCLVWFVYVYQSADGWRPTGFQYKKTEAVFEALK